MPSIRTAPLVLATLLACAKPIAVTLAPGVQLEPGSEITIIRPAADPANVYGQLEQRLMVSGFTVMEGGGQTIQSTTRARIDSGSASISTSTGVVQRVPSRFALRFAYSTRPALGTPDVFESFAASVVDLNTMKLVATADFGQGKLSGKQVSHVLDEFVRGLTRR